MPPYTSKLAEFFHEERDESLIFLNAVNELRQLGDEDITLLMGIARRISSLTADKPEEGAAE